MPKLIFVLLLLGLAQAQNLSFRLVASDLERPTFLTYAPDGSDRLFVTEQTGKVRVIQGGRLRPEAFLDLSNRIACCGERGLLSLAFHPDFKNNGFFFVNYTRSPDGATVIARYKVAAEGNRADPASARVLLVIEQPFANHNGGQLAFGPDGYLYIGMGDGGSGGDPLNHGQNLNSLLGKILRIDVNKEENGRPYAIPPSNPFVGRQGARPEIWSYGWRNPWRFSFDRETGDMWIADVGQNQWEEVNLEPRGRGGLNYGWRLMEGSACYNPSSNCNSGNLVLPVLEYDHSQGCSITGGYRYRGRAMASLRGAYIYGDYCSGRVWVATEQGGRWAARRSFETGYSISSFGEDAEGELYVLDHRGAVYRLELR